MGVLNLIITGIPSILDSFVIFGTSYCSFKPYYNWNTFNTILGTALGGDIEKVLNLIITGIPSILNEVRNAVIGFGVLNLIITGIPSILPFHLYVAFVQI